MDGFFSSDIGQWSLIVVPGMLLAFVANALVAGRLRGSAASALAGVLLMILFIGALAAGSVYGFREFALDVMIPQCQAEQRAASMRGEALLLDCDSEGLIVVFPALIGAAAFVFGLFGAAFTRFARKR